MWRLSVKLPLPLPLPLSGTWPSLQLLVAGGRCVQASEHPSEHCRRQLGSHNTCTHEFKFQVTSTSWETRDKFLNLSEPRLSYL